MERTGLLKWLILSHLTEKELEDIEFAVVYGSERYANEGQSALFITKGNYEVFGTGYNNMVEFSERVIPFSKDKEKSYLGTHVTVEELCGLGIRKIVVGDHFGAALSTTNEVYVWGELDMTVKNPGLVVMFEKYKPGTSCAKCENDYCPAVFSDSSLVSAGSFNWCKSCDWYPSYSARSEPPPPETEVLKFIRGDKVLFPCLRCGRKCTTISLSIYVLNFCDRCKLIREVSPKDTPTNEMVAPRRISFPPDVRVTDIESGRSFLVMKTVSGRLLIWGAIDKFHYKGYIDNPDKIIVKSISCGASHAAVASNCGKLYTFGYGKEGQLGYRWQEDMGHLTLRRVQMPGRVTKFCCRRNGTVCLMEDGTVSIFGNYIKVIPKRPGNKSNPAVTLTHASHRDCVRRPVKVNGKFTDIACSHLTNIFVAKSAPLVFSWGHLVRNRTRGSKISSFDCSEALADLPVSFSGSQSANRHQLQVSSPTAEMYGKSLISDMTLKLSDGLFPVHKFVLYTNSTYFKRLFEETDVTPKTLDVTVFNPKSYRTLLKYFYQVPIEDSDLTCDDLFDLYALAVGYRENDVMADALHRLKWKMTPVNAGVYLEKAKNAGLDLIVEECEKLMEYPIIPDVVDLEDVYIWSEPTREPDTVNY